MSNRRRSRGSRPASPAGKHSIPELAEAAPERQPLPQWRWRAFPVFFMFSVGLFFGVFVGVPAGIAGEAGNNVPQYVVFLGSAILLGLALSHVVVRWLLSRGIAGPRPKRR